MPPGGPLSVTVRIRFVEAELEYETGQTLQLVAPTCDTKGPLAWILCPSCVTTGRREKEPDAHGREYAVVCGFQTLCPGTERRAGGDSHTQEEIRSVLRWSPTKDVKRSYATCHSQWRRASRGRRTTSSIGEALSCFGRCRICPTGVAGNMRLPATGLPSGRSVCDAARFVPFRTTTGGCVAPTPDEAERGSGSPPLVSSRFRRTGNRRQSRGTGTMPAYLVG